MRSRNYRLAPRALPWLALCATLCATGCQWDSSVYDAAAKNNGYVVACSPTIIVPDNDECVTDESIDCHTSCNGYVTIGEDKCYYQDNACQPDNAIPEVKDCKDTDNFCKDCRRYNSSWEKLAVKTESGSDVGTTTKMYVTKVCTSFSSEECKNPEDVAKDLMYGEGTEKKLRICTTDFPKCTFIKSEDAFYCVPECSKTICGTSCVDLMNDSNNCGKCGEACQTYGENYTCVDGYCESTACVDGQVLCDGKCVNPLTDVDYCGATGTLKSCVSEGVTCKPGEKCAGGICAASCLAGQVYCGGKCIDPLSDVTFCGATGTTDSCESNGVTCKPVKNVLAEYVLHPA